MKYGESTFDILYLVFAILTGILILIKHRNKNDVLMGTAALVLGLGDSFHLVMPLSSILIRGNSQQAQAIPLIRTRIRLTNT